jgi:hypothetical protein
MIAVVFLVIAFVFIAENAGDRLLLILYLAACISLIWFGDELGGLTGVRFGDIESPVITKASPGVIIRFLGWCLLVVPFILVVYRLIGEWVKRVDG